MKHRTIKYRGGAPPYGYRRTEADPHVYEKDPEEQKVIRRAKLLQREGHGYDVIAAAISVGAKNRAGGHFQATQIRRMLTKLKREKSYVSSMVILTLRMRQDLHRKLERLAEADGKPLATWIARVLDAYSSEMINDEPLQLHDGPADDQPLLPARAVAEPRQGLAGSISSSTSPMSTENPPTNFSMSKSSGSNEDASSSSELEPPAGCEVSDLAALLEANLPPAARRGKSSRV